MWPMLQLDASFDWGCEPPDWGERVAIGAGDWSPK